MSIYISRSNTVPEEFLKEFSEHLRSIGYSGVINSWKRGSIYSRTPLERANAVILLIDSSAALVSKGSYEEYLTAIILKIPIFLAYKTKNYGFQFYCFSVQKINSNLINCAKITFGANCTEKLLTLIGAQPEAPCSKSSDFGVEKILKPTEVITLNIELLLLRR